MRILLLFFLVTASGRLSFSATVGSSILRNAFALAQYKALIADKGTNSKVITSRQGTFENIPLCDTATGQAASNLFQECGNCYEQLIQADVGTSPEVIEDTCAPGCCGEYNLQSVATGHFIHCKDGCCRRLVSLQVLEGATPEQLELATLMQVIVNNEYTVTGVGDVDRCTLEEAPSEDDACGPRCAFLFNYPERCEGRTTVNVPVFGQNMDPANLPCSQPVSPETDDAEDDDSGGTASGDGTGGVEATPESGGNGNSGSGGSSDVCVDARALRHLRAEDLVFEKHALAHVLCDANESCSTAGHMVVFHGETMMMRTYCDLVECTTKVMHVNSPRFSRRIRVPSRTPGLEFTAFAARYETRAEEMLMSLALRAGL